MFAPETTAVGEIVWGDRDGDTAKFTVRFPFSISRDNAFSSLQSIASAIQGISNAVPVRITVRYGYHEDSPDVPSLLSNVGRYLCLYYSNGVDTEPIFVPSGDESLLETSGRFAGIRLDLADPSVVSVALALSTALLATSDQTGAGWDRVLVVGGITR